MCVDLEARAVFFTTSKALYRLCLNEQQVEICSYLVTAGYLPADGSGKVLDLVYLFNTQSVCFATQSGDVILYNRDTKELECAGSVDDGLRAMGWSPDQEIVVLVTGHETVILMTRQFEPLLESPLHPPQFGEREPVTVGWGKKETQFHGTEGKDAAKAKQNTISAVTAWDDRVPRVSWRGDGQFFAINAVVPNKNARIIRVWNREGVLQYTSDYIDGLEQSISWKPSGSVITCTTCGPNIHQVVFFEKNCLRHGEFTLPFLPKSAKVREILWNLDSSMMLLWCEDIIGENEPTCNSHLSLWTVSNYHWYQKQNMRFNDADKVGKVACVQWDAENYGSLHVLTEKGAYCQYTWNWTVNHSRGNCGKDQSTVAVIDGNSILVTPFRAMVVPPPLCSYKITLPMPVNHIVFGPASCCNDFLAVLSDNRVAVFKEDVIADIDSGEFGVKIELDAAGGGSFKNAVDPVKFLGICKMACETEDEVDAIPLCLYHITWVNEETIVMIFSDKDEMYNIAVAKLKLDDGANISICSMTPIEGSVAVVFPLPDEKSVALQLHNREILKFEAENEDIFPWTLENGDSLCLPQICQTIKVLTSPQQQHVLALSDKSRFFVDEKEVASNCTSFFLHGEFILYITHVTRLHCVTIGKLLQRAVNTQDHSADLGEQVRQLERGSRIIVSVAGDTKLILQMPRGNLECIHPRVLVVHAIKGLLDEHENYRALVLMRKHRINMNLLFDHNPDTFLSDTVHIIQQVGDVHLINLFLSSLQDEDTTKTVYKDSYLDVTLRKQVYETTKVNAVCDAVCNAIKKLDSKKYILCILTAFSKKNPPELDKALQEIQMLKENKSTKCENVVSLIEALNHVLYLVDVNELFDIALGTYDFDLVLMVAEKSQKDPKEYLQFLNQLRKMETNYQKFTIDKHLKKYSKALTHIINCDGRDEECLAFIKAHTLYSEALQYLRKGTKTYKLVSELYGDYLDYRGNHAEAGIVFSRAAIYNKALNVFLKCGNWQQGFCCAIKMDYNEDQLSSLARAFSVVLQNEQSYVDAAYLLEQYTKDPESAIMMLIQGREWNNALHLIYRYNLLGKIGTSLMPVLENHCVDMATSIESNEKLFRKYTQRLQIVRIEKQKEILDDVQDADNFSETSSVSGYSHRTWSSTTGSTATGRTSRQQKKMAKKLVSLKEGSKHEEIALLQALTELITLNEQTQEECSSLVLVLLLMNLEALACKIQDSLRSFAKTIEKFLPEIWVSNETTQFGPSFTANDAAKLQQSKYSDMLHPELSEYGRYLFPPQIKKTTKWKLEILKPK